jgi:peptidoglycan/LPS O-acetylase OafA/YrhL
MNRSLAFEFLLYGLLLAGVSWFIQRAAPDFGRTTLIAGLAGGTISVLWGVLVLCGYRRRWWIILTLAAVGFTLLSQAVMAWMQPTGGDGAPPTRLIAVWITVLLVFTFAMLMNLLHGQGREAEIPETPASKPAPNTAKR